MASTSSAVARSSSAADVEACRSYAAAQIAALLANPPAWLHIEYAHESSPTALDVARQHGRGPRAGKLAWRWVCSVKGPTGSPYAGDTYRVLVTYSRPTGLH